MQSKATTVDQYLAELPDDRRKTIEAVRNIILKSLDRDYEEGMQYGMIGYYVPHRVYPAGYHCDPKQPLPFAALASQKNYMTLHLMSIYANANKRTWFEQAWAKTGKKLDVGKACIRFKRLEDLALDVIAEAIRQVPAKKYLEFCEAAVQPSAKRKAKRDGQARASTNDVATAKRRAPGREAKSS